MERTGRVTQISWPRVAAVCTVLGAVLVVASAAFAQATLTGVVKDTSGAVLPGVTVEASSPALIEKVRSTITDGKGAWTIVDLRPGTYAVAFTLTGFNTVKREGIELTGNFTATVNTELRVGTVEETVTVTGETPASNTAVKRSCVVAMRRSSTSPRSVTIRI